MNLVDLAGALHDTCARRLPWVAVGAFHESIVGRLVRDSPLWLIYTGDLKRGHVLVLRMGFDL